MMFFSKCFFIHRFAQIAIHTDISPATQQCLQDNVSRTASQMTRVEFAATVSSFEQMGTDYSELPDHFKTLLDNVAADFDSTHRRTKTRVKEGQIRYILHNTPAGGESPPLPGMGRSNKAISARIKDYFRTKDEMTAHSTAVVSNNDNNSNCGDGDSDDVSKGI